MSVVLRDFIRFPFNDGKGIRTNQLDGDITSAQLAETVRDAINKGTLLFPDADGNLPEPSDNQGRVAASGNHVLQSIDHGGHDKVVVFKRYSATRVVLTGEPAISTQEGNFQGSFDAPPDIANYSASHLLWDRGSQVWLWKQNNSDTTWRSFGGPVGYSSGSLYADEDTAARHISELGKIVIIGHGSGQNVFIATTYTAATADDWQWDITGLTIGDVATVVEAHNVATDNHASIRTAIASAQTTADNAGSAASSAEDRLDALNEVEISAYDATATYSRGSANSIVTHASGLFIYTSSTERSSNHDPDTQPGYWLKLSEGMAYEVISSGSHRIAARTIIINGDNDNVYLCTTTQTTPRDLAYIHAQAQATGGSFIHLNAAGSGTSVTANPSGTDGDTLSRLALDGTNYNLPTPMGGGLTSVASDTTLSGSGTSGSPLGVSDDGITTAKIADDAVTGDKIDDNTIHGGALIDGTIPTGKIGDSQVTGAKISNNAVSTDKVANNAITEAKIADDAVDTAQIADEAVTQVKLAEFSVVTGKIANNQVTTAKIADDAITTDKLADNAAGEGKVPIDNTLQFDGSGNLGVEISTVIDLLDEDIRYYSDDTTREDAHQASKGVVFLDTSAYAKRIHSIEWDFEGDGVGHNYTTFIVGIDSNDDIDFVYGESETLFNVGTSGTRRFDFDSSGLRIPGSVTRLGVFLTRTGSDNTWETKVYRGQPADDSPRQSYPDAIVDFPFWRSARFASGRPELGEHIDNYITNGEIYGYPKIRYTLELEHASLVGDGNISASHISSGSAAADAALLADGSGAAAFRGVVVHGDNIVDNTIPTAKYGNASITTGKIANAAITEAKLAQAVRDLLNDGGVTHIESGATYNNNVITVSTTGTVRGGDGILFSVPSPFGTSATQEISLAIDGQANSEYPLHDRNGDVLHENDLTVGSVYIAISDASSWDVLVLPVGSGTGTTVEANPSGTDGDDLTRLAVDGTNYNLSSSISWGFLIDTLIVPELNQDAITTARIVLEDSALTHYLAFLDWTTTNLDMISHLPVGAHIGLRQGTTIRILRVEAEWDSTNNRYQVTNVNAGGILEASSGTATELLLTAGVGGGTIYTTGSIFPSSPVSGQLFEFNAAAASITAKDYDGTTDLTSASRGDLFKYDSTSTNWVKQSSTGGAADLKGQRIASITFGAVPTSGSSLETSASGSGTRMDSGDIGGTGSDVGWVRDTGAPTAFTVERIGASSDEPIINVPQTRAASNSFGYLVELEILPSLGSLSNAISVSATSIILTLESTEDIAIGDELRIESEVVTVDAVPADGATGVAARTYGIIRGSNAAAHTNTRLVQKNAYELESDGIIIQGGPSPQQGGSSSRSTISLGTGGLVDATGIRELGVRLASERSTTGLSGLEQVRFIDLITQGDNAVLLPSTRITVYLAIIAGADVGSGGQESPGTEGVSELTADLVEVTLWKWVLTTDGKPAVPGAHWRFDDEWDGTTPQSADGGGWYISQATALDEADNNPAFSQDTWTLWTANEQVRRRVVSEAYSYTDGGYTITAVWDIQYSTDDGSTWTNIEPTDLYHYIRYRDQETGLWGPIIPVGTNVGSNDWQPIRTNDLVYPASTNVDELGAAYDFGNFAELLFIVAGYRLVSVDDGMGGTVEVGINGPWHHFVLNRGGGWPVADISESQDNNDADDGASFQFSYSADSTTGGLVIWERGDAVNPGNPTFVQAAGEPPTQLGGHFKIVSTDGDEAHVTKFRFFAFSHQFARTTMSIFARYR